MLQLENIQAGYTAGSLILQGISLELKRGEVLGIIGLNGCGKSTLGKSIMNMAPYRSGRVLFMDRDISKLRTDEVQNSGIKMVMQGGRVFSQMTILEHLEFAGKIKSQKELHSRITEMEHNYGLRIFEGGMKANQKGNSLSGGQRQQLAMAMALIDEPAILILDEPSAGLSPVNLRAINQVLLNLKQGDRISIILIEQNIKMASELSNRLLKLERGTIGKEFIIDNTFDLTQLNHNIFN